MKILFLTTPYIIDPLGIGFLSSLAKQRGHKVDIELSDHVSYKTIKNYDIVAFSVTTGQHPFYEHLSRKIKACCPEILIIWGGPHPTYFPTAHKSIDYLVQGEADTSWPKLLDAIDHGVYPPDRVIKPEPLVQDLDSLPFPDRALIYRFAPNLNNPLKNILTSRGCPFSCPYCYNGSYKALYRGQKIVRTHSIDRVIAECLEVKHKWNARFIFFIDDEFTMNDKRLSDMLDVYSMHVRLPFHAQLRIDQLTEEKARALKLAGCVSVTFAIESGGEEYRKKMLNRHMTDKQILDGAALLHRVGLKFRTENMIGLPHESFKDAMNTLKLNIKCKPELAWASLYQPYPGTPLGDLCVKEGLFKGNVDDIKPSFFEDTVLPLKNKKMFVNLQRLFGLVASYPQLRWILPIALRVPTNKLYAKLYATWKKFRYDKTLYKFD